MSLGQLAAFVTLIVLSGNATATDKFLCVTEKATGFRYSEPQGWQPAKFIADDKYIVAPSEEAGLAYTVTRLGYSYPIFSCKKV